MRKFVLTGGPSTGKTSVILELEKRGFKVSHEIAREILNVREIKMQPKGCRSCEATSDFSEHPKVAQSNERLFDETKELDFIELEREILRRQISKESCEGVGILFIDRGLPDILAYCKILLKEIPKEIQETDFKNRYEAVFIMDKLDFVEDGIRYETKEEAEKVHSTIIETYKELGYKIIHVPVMPIEARTDFILEKINL